MQRDLWIVPEDLRWVSDSLPLGQHVLELNATSVVVQSYVWGLDRSGTMDGAGGVGGLLWVTVHPGSGAGGSTHFCAYDGKGNVGVLGSALGASPTASYEYGPSAELLRITGLAAGLNPFRFSAKHICNTSAWLYMSIGRTFLTSANG